MNMLIEKPPIWDECNAKFKLVHGTVFTYGNTLYNPDGIEISKDLFIHEQKHAQQQAWNETVAKIWWARYLEDPQFRLEQEVAAYAAQYRYICSVVKDRNARDKNLRILAGMLASPIYGNMIHQVLAANAIKVGRLTSKNIV